MRAALTVSMFAALATVATVVSVSAQNTRSGRRTAEIYCARCHAIGRKGDSPFPKATPFRIIPTKYPVDELEEAFGEGTTSNHLGMPDFEFTPAEVIDLLAYIKSLGPRKSRR